MQKWSWRVLSLLGGILLLGFTLWLWAGINNTPRGQTARVPPPFYDGGLVKGSGGQAYGSDTSNSSTPANPENLFLPSPARSLSGGLVSPSAYPSSAVCARCHAGIHEAWKGSLHAQSATDPWYLKVKDLFEFEAGSSATRLCAGCHAPIALMTGEVGLYNRESVSSQEGVSCFFCHTVEKVTGGGGGLVSNPGRVRSYGGQNPYDEAGINLAEHLLMANPQIHREDMIRPSYRSSQMCQGCHDFKLEGVPLQSTFEEWQASSYAQEGVTCTGCHFTPGAGVNVERGKKSENYPLGREGPLLRHTLGGGSTVIAKGGQRNRALLREAVGLKTRVKPSSSGPQLEVTVQNLLAGHSLPTGVTDMRVMWLELRAWDPFGRVTLESGVRDPAGHLPPKTWRFHTVLGDAAGQPLTRHDIWRAKSVLEDIRIPAKESRSRVYTLPQGTAKVQVRLLWQDAPQDFYTQVVQQVLGEDEVVTELHRRTLQLRALKL